MTEAEETVILVALIETAHQMATLGMTNEDLQATAHQEVQGFHPVSMDLLPQDQELHLLYQGLHQGGLRLDLTLLSWSEHAQTTCPLHHQVPCLT